MAPLTRFAAPLYKNTGSVARDHLASERTYLAWTRTGLGFLALGIAIERFSQLDSYGVFHCAKCKSPTAAEEGHGGQSKDKRSLRILVGSLLAMGSGSIVYAMGRYISVQKLLEKGEFRPAYRGVGFVGGGLACLAGGVVAQTVQGWKS